MGEPRYTEKEMVRINRQAFEYGAAWNECEHRNALCTHFVNTAARRSAAAVNYPMPRVERPRVVTDPHAGGYEWRISESGKAEWRCTSACAGSIAKEFHHPGAGNEVCTVTAERVKMWADLLAHPSEFVDDEG